FSDGKVAGWGPHGAFLITSPNVDYVPEIVEGIVAVHIRENGRFGKHDPILWPQVYASKYPYLVALPKGPSLPANEPAPSLPPSPMSTPPSKDDFVVLPNTPIQAFGRFAPQYLDRLEPLVLNMSSKVRQYIPIPSTIDLEPLHRHEQDMTTAWHRVRFISATYRDQVVQLGAVQRYWLLCSAFMTYYDLLYHSQRSQPLPLHSQLMGAWTSEPKVAQTLFGLGIPVWLVRASHVVSPDIRVGKVVPVVSADGLCHQRFYGVEPVYRGLAGAGHLQATFTSPAYADLSRIPTANISNPDDFCAMSNPQPPRHYASRVSGLQSGHRRSSRGGPASREVGRMDKQKHRQSPYDILARDRSTLAHPSQVRGRDKFIDVAHPWMPPSLPSWDGAMRAVDRSDRAKPAPEIWGYWIPEPALLLGPKDPARLQRYVMNWLRAQPVWLYMLQIPGSGAVKVSTQSWRNFLNGVPDDPKSFTKTGKRAYEIKQIFGRVFSEAEVNPSAQGKVSWHQHSLTDVDDQMGRLIVWETFELGFRYELWAMDRFMRPMESPADETARAARLAAVFPARSLWVVPYLPSKDTWGLFAPLPHRRINYLNALREVLRFWPRCPPAIKQASSLQTGDSVEAIQELEMWLALFYTQTFFDASGRAPIVPHSYPLQAN
ncbi:hypothetical protein LXA43DRAFT_903422, partial [Ganoderma leucocontextum]